MKAIAVIPALNEGGSIASVIADVPADACPVVIVVDGGSNDDTCERARAAGAIVITERRRGYGWACFTGAREAGDHGADIVAFLDAAGCEDATDLRRVLRPIVDGEADLVVGSRTRGVRESGALRTGQRIGNGVATALIWAMTGHRYTDLGSMRAIRVQSLVDLQMRERGSGWPVEMQLKAAQRKLRVHEVPIHYRRRVTGRSKVSGSVVGAARAGADILRVVLTGGFFGARR